MKTTTTTASADHPKETFVDNNTEPDELYTAIEPSGLDTPSYPSDYMRTHTGKGRTAPKPKPAPKPLTPEQLAEVSERYPAEIAAEDLAKLRRLPALLREASGEVVSGLESISYAGTQTRAAVGQPSSSRAPHPDDVHELPHPPTLGPPHLALNRRKVAAAERTDALASILKGELNGGSAPDPRLVTEALASVVDRTTAYLTAYYRMVHHHARFGTFTCDPNGEPCEHPDATEDAGE